MYMKLQNSISVIPAEAGMTNMWDSNGSDPNPAKKVRILCENYFD